MGPGAEMIVTGDLEGFCNLFSSILSVEGKTCSMQCKPEPPGGHFQNYSFKSSHQMPLMFVVLPKLSQMSIRYIYGG